MVESAPVETTLDDSPRARTHEVWRALVDGAERTLDIEQFYVSNAPGGRLEPILAAIERAAARGVTVRLIADATFADEYPDSLERLSARVAVQRLDASKSMGGVQHAKYFVVDGCALYLGSANFDWRSLEHIHELGLRIQSRALAQALGEVFELDWAFAGGQPRPDPTESFAAFPVTVGELSLRPALSPKGFLPDVRSFDLPELVSLIDAAEAGLRVELLSYELTSRDGSAFRELDDALRRAAGRGVAVQLLVSHWDSRAGRIEALQALAEVAGVELRIVTIPEHSSGFIPFARVIHAKYLVVDERVSWLGTSNWGGDYFFRSRNVGVIAEGRALARELGAVFDGLWASRYAAPVDPERDYPPPRIAE
jgi:phosphatidylserine/phosphatidylglycerophosphate/cardiolipin synthase-like enzyme